ncbi:hypothetical protein ROZALSC1DRAFT_29661 [Rozella allomycis CSF55]|uniref:Uncharacterized protein n=1 Tax=Rozella allomycis (strain CSF55) TaxID=988480 RepID=A0A075B1F1_ROZAC|nr:hypothetical protein O9G_002923 [Rozella allomycis CSF55]RKP18674.1 hypothetical protein ROZALSC1DRAFT_29661 [Rozella allomycis CSF55]|eukprot:EPZ36421.1 hypothetical protein O9G_002923 [Rozella allomycis CSF55]
MFLLMLEVYITLAGTEYEYQLVIILLFKYGQKNTKVTLSPITPYTKRKRFTAVELMEKLESVVFDFGNALKFTFKKNYYIATMTKMLLTKQSAIFVPVTVETGCIGGHAVMY